LGAGISIKSFFYFRVFLLFLFFTVFGGHLRNVDIHLCIFFYFSFFIRFTFLLLSFTRFMVAWRRFWSWLFYFSSLFILLLFLPEWKEMGDEGDGGYGRMVWFLQGFFSFTLFLLYLISVLGTLNLFPSYF